jgi:hypothetical protein
MHDLVADTAHVIKEFDEGLPIDNRPAESFPQIRIPQQPDVITEHQLFDALRFPRAEVGMDGTGVGMGVGRP